MRRDCGVLDTVDNDDDDDEDDDDACSAVKSHVLLVGTAIVAVVVTRWRRVFM